MHLVIIRLQKLLGVVLDAMSQLTCQSVVCLCHHTNSIDILSLASHHSLRNLVTPSKSINVPTNYVIVDMSAVTMYKFPTILKPNHALLTKLSQMKKNFLTYVQLMYSQGNLSCSQKCINLENIYRQITLQYKYLANYV